MSKDGDISGPYFLVFGPEITPYLGIFHLKFRFSSGLEDMLCQIFSKLTITYRLFLSEINLESVWIEQVLFVICPYYDCQAAVIRKPFMV